MLIRSRPTGKPTAYSLQRARWATYRRKFVGFVVVLHIVALKKPSEEVAFRRTSPVINTVTLQDSTRHHSLTNQKPIPTIHRKSRQGKRRFISKQQIPPTSVAQSLAKMSIVEDCNSLENGDVVVFLKQLSDSQRETLNDSLQQCLENGGETMPEFDFSCLYGMKESDGNERTKESENLEIFRAFMISNSPGVVDIQSNTEDQSLFFDIPLKDFGPMVESHNHQFFQGHDTESEFSDTGTFSTILDPSQPAYLSPELFGLHLPETAISDDWGSNIGQNFDIEPRGLAESAQSCPINGSTHLRVTSGSGGALTTPPKTFVASQRSMFDSCQVSDHPSATTVPTQAVVKTECNEEWPASEVNEGVYDAKKERRRQQNRTAARRCRNRKKETFESMLKAMKKAKLEKEELQKVVVCLREKLRCVVELISLHQTHCNLQLVTSQLQSPVSASTR